MWISVAPWEAASSRPFTDFSKIMGIGARLVRGPGKGAERAAVHADIGIVDVAVDIEKDPPAVLSVIHRSCQGAYLQKLVGAEQQERLGIVDTHTVQDLFGYGSKRNHISPFIIQQSESKPGTLNNQITLPPSTFCRGCSPIPGSRGPSPPQNRPGLQPTRAGGKRRAWPGQSVPPCAQAGACSPGVSR